MDKRLVDPCVLLSFSSLNWILFHHCNDYSSCYSIFLIFPSEAIILNPLSNQHSKMKKKKNHTNVLYLCPLCSHQPAHLDMSGNYFGVIFVPARWEDCAVYAVSSVSCTNQMKFDHCHPLCLSRRATGANGKLSYSAREPLVQVSRLDNKAACHK